MSKKACMLNIKGGVGKTISVVNMAACLAENNLRVLIVDLDPQANSTKYLNRHDKTRTKLSAYNMLVDKNLDIRDVIVSTDIKGVDIVPSNIRLEDCVDEILIDTRRNRENRLKNALAPIENEYDFIFFDPSPFYTILTTNALVASDYVLVPIKIDLFALDGFDYLLQKVETIRDEFNPKLQLLGAFITVFERVSKTSREVAEYLKSELGNKLFNTTIRKNQALVDSTFQQTPIIVYDKHAPGAEDYRNLVKEVFKVG